MERVPTHSHAGGTGFKAPPGVTIKQIPPEKSIGSMMVSGELDAVVHYIRHDNLVDRSRIDLNNHPDIKTIFPDPRAEGVRYFRKTGVYPINHGMVVQRAIAEKHPWVILNLLTAFEKANAIANAQRMEHVEYHIASGMVPPEAEAALRTPVLQHGVKANRHILEAAAQMSLEQGLTPRLMKLDEVFAKSTMDQ